MNSIPQAALGQQAAPCPASLDPASLAGARRCPDCGPIEPDLQEQGAHVRATCPLCGRWIKWVRRLQAAPLKPPTEAQLRYLARLGYRGPSPKTLEDASRLIDARLRGGAR